MKVQHPTLKTWIEKTQVMTMITQTRGKNDTPEPMRRNDYTKTKLQENGRKDPWKHKINKGREKRKYHTN